MIKTLVMNSFSSSHFNFKEDNLITTHIFYISSRTLHKGSANEPVSPHWVLALNMIKIISPFRLITESLRVVLIPLEASQERKHRGPSQRGGTQHDFKWNGRLMSGAFLIDMRDFSRWDRVLTSYAAPICLKAAWYTPNNIYCKFGWMHSEA